MSDIHNHITELTLRECRCGRPTRDAAYVCDDCGDNLSRALGDVPWLIDELGITISRQKGVDYRVVGGSKGGTAPRGDVRIAGDNTAHPARLDSPAHGAHVQDDPGHMGASEAQTHLGTLLVSWALFCAAEHVRSRDPRGDHIPGTHDKPATSVDLSRWLMWRVDGLTLHDIGPDAVEEITSAVAHCHRLIDRPADKWYAGPCNAERDDDACGTDLYATTTTGSVKCRTCGAVYDVAARRAWLLAAAEDRLADATTLARSVSWLGAAPLNAARVRQWAARSRIVAKGHAADGRPLYRIGDAIDLLAGSSKEAS